MHRTNKICCFIVSLLMLNTVWSTPEGQHNNPIVQPAMFVKETLDAFQLCSQEIEIELHRLGLESITVDSLIQILAVNPQDPFVRALTDMSLSDAIAELKNGFDALGKVCLSTSTGLLHSLRSLSPGSKGIEILQLAFSKGLDRNQTYGASLLLLSASAAEYMQKVKRMLTTEELGCIDSCIGSVDLFAWNAMANYWKKIYGTHNQAYARFIMKISAENDSSLGQLHNVLAYLRLSGINEESFKSDINTRNVQFNVRHYSTIFDACAVMHKLVLAHLQVPEISVMFRKPGGSSSTERLDKEQFFKLLDKGFFLLQDRGMVQRVGSLSQSQKSLLKELLKLDLHEYQVESTGQVLVPYPTNMTHQEDELKAGSYVFEFECIKPDLLYKQNRSTELAVLKGGNMVAHLESAQMLTLGAELLTADCLPDFKLKYFTIPQKVRVNCDRYFTESCMENINWLARELDNVATVEKIAGSKEELSLFKNLVASKFGVASTDISFE